ncbi:MAG: hypothetical protein MJ057_07200 [Sphaerochaetaceae bacterium]|nr:hypothetical protein [Sphaerochaetaceae bacterium]
MLVQSFIPTSDNGLEIGIDNVRSTLMKSITIDGIHLRAGDMDVVDIEKIEVSLNLWDVLKFAIGGKASMVDATISNVKVQITDSNVQALMNAFSAFSAGSDDSDVTSGSASGESSKPKAFDELGVSAALFGLDIYVDYNGISVISVGSNATAKLAKGLNFENADLNIPRVFASHLGPSDMNVSDIRLSVDENYQIYGSIGGVEYGEYAKLNGLSAIAQFAEGILSSAFYMDKASGQYSNDSVSISADLESSTARINYRIADGNASFLLESGNIIIDSANPELTLCIGDTEIGGQFDGSDNIALVLDVSSVSFDALDTSFGFRDISADIDLSLDGFSSIGQVLIASSQMAGNENLIFTDASLENLSVDYSYSSSGLGVRLRGSAKGTSPNTYLGQISTTVDVSAQTRDFRSLSFASLNLQDLQLASIHDDAYLSLDLFENGNLSGSFGIRDDVSSNVSIDLDSRNIDLRLYLNGLKPSSYVAVYDNILSNVQFVDERTVLDGSIVLSSQMTEGFSDWLKAMLRGEYSAKFPIESPFDVLQTSRVSLNTAIEGINISEDGLAGAMTLDAFVDKDAAQITNFAVSAKGMRLSYAGSIDMKELLPDGRLSLQNASDGSELASILFQYHRGERIYEFLGQTPLDESLSLQGSLNWEDLQRIVASARIDASVLSEDGIAFDVTISPSPLQVEVCGDEINLAVTMADNKILVSGNLDDLLINASDSMQIEVDTEIGGFYDMSEGTFDASLRSLSVKLSDLLSIGLDLDVNDHSISLGRLLVGRGDSITAFSGGADFEFASLDELLTGDTSSVNGTFDLRTTGGDYARGSVIHDQYYLDVQMNGFGENQLDAGTTILGTRGSGFYGSAFVQWGDEASNRIDLNGIYDDNVLFLYDTYGNIGSLNLDNIQFEMDLSKMMLNASLDFLNERVFDSGELKSQKGTLTLGAKVEGLSNSLFQLFAGLDYEIVFDLGLSNVRLADGFKVADTSAKMVFHNGLLTFDGDLINGSYDSRNNYIDMSIDRKLLVGVDVKGYLGDELDLMVSNVYFPMRLLNQVMDSTIFAFEDGFLEGDILINGPASAPSFYGMAYCQSFGMSLFYLPEQIMSIKNVSISLQDHSIVMTKSAMTGYSNLDGRYFYGDASIEIIMQGLNFQSMDLQIHVDDDFPVDFWMPQRFGGTTDFEVRGDVTGFVDFTIENGIMNLSTDVTLSNTLIDFTLDQMPDWFYKPGGGSTFNLDIAINTGKNIEFYYPEKDNSFLNFTLLEGETVELKLNDGKFSTDGGLAVKTGQVYYFHNDFIITEGSVDLSQKKYNASNAALPFVLNLTAQLTDYDANGKKVIIDMILKDATLDNISPRFQSTPTMTQNEILSLLGQSVLSSSSLDSQVSVRSLAQFARTAADALTRVGVIESNSSYSIASTIRNSLNLDIFSARSNIISNVIVDALPGELAGRGDVSMLARYLDGTSLYAGKYMGSDLFLRLTLMLKADSSNSLSDEVGHFLAKDLILDTEISIDWNNPMGTFTIFTQPHELSAFDILDTIGFSVTKQIQY